MMRWFKGIAENMDGARLHFVVYGDDAECCRTRVERYALVVVSIGAASGYVPRGIGEYTFRCVADEEKL